MSGATSKLGTSPYSQLKSVGGKHNRRKLTEKEGGSVSGETNVQAGADAGVKKIIIELTRPDAKQAGGGSEDMKTKRLAELQVAISVLSDMISANPDDESLAQEINDA